MSDDATILKFPVRDDSLSTIDRITPGATSSALGAIRRLYNESFADTRAAAKWPPQFAGALTKGGAHFRLGMATAVAALLSEVATLVACRPVTVDVDAARDYLENSGTSAQATIRAAMDRDPDPTPARG